MAEFLTTTGVSHHLERMIDQAGKWLLLVSPFLRTNPVIRQQLGHKFASPFPAWIVYGKSEMNKDEEAWWKKFPNSHLGFLDNLHAKCYLSEAVAIVTSMNLYDFSQQNNNEMGILLTRESDRELYESVLKYAGRMIAYSNAPKEAKEKWAKISGPVDQTASKGVTGQSILERIMGSKPAQSQDQWVRKTKSAPVKKRIGYCIRCQEQIKPDLELPFCSAHRNSWLEWENPDYSENYCYACGEPIETSQRKPLCNNCYRKFNRGIDIFGA
jgi:hypothetical protein